ncbi:MAG: hypothetical protein J2P54_08190 [Bradyrhizobiaceae bacterium]|nr:hypothetical protein [Bradyrhizobiaceae bacterium]
MTAMSEEVVLLAGWLAEIDIGLKSRRLWRVGTTVPLMSRDRDPVLDGSPLARPRKPSPAVRQVKCKGAVKRHRRGAGMKRAAKRRVGPRWKLQLRPRAARV